MITGQLLSVLQNPNVPALQRYLGPTMGPLRILERLLGSSRLRFGECLVSH
jgi:hypothetical protein